MILKRILIPTFALLLLTTIDATAQRTLLKLDRLAPQLGLSLTQLNEAIAIKETYTEQRRMIRSGGNLDDDSLPTGVPTGTPTIEDIKVLIQEAWEAQEDAFLALLEDRQIEIYAFIKAARQ